MLPKISIITISFNAVRCIEATLKSVIEQDYPDLEYIVIDGMSQDGTVNIIKKYGDKINVFISEPDNGIYDAMNKGIKLATGEWILFMNAGDSFYSSNVITHIFHLCVDEDVVAIYGNVNMVYDSWSAFTYPNNVTLLREKMPFSHQAIFVRTWLHRRYPFSMKYRIAADYDFFYGLFMSSNVFRYVDVVIANYDAVGGLSAKQCVLARKENGIINGKSKSLKWKIKYVFFILKVNGISLLPHKLYQYIRKLKIIH